MKESELTGWERRKAVLVKWMILNILLRISPYAVLAFCLETANLYYENIESSEEV